MFNAGDLVRVKDTTIVGLIQRLNEESAHLILSPVEGNLYVREYKVMSLTFVSDEMSNELKNKLLNIPIPISIIKNGVIYTPDRKKIGNGEKEIFGYKNGKNWLITTPSPVDSDCDFVEMLRQILVKNFYLLN